MPDWTYNTSGDPPTDGPQITSIGVIFTAIALVLVTLRVYVRGFMLKALGLDDWIIIATWIASCGFTIVTALQTKWGLGLKNLEHLPQENYYSFMLLQFIGAPFYIISILGFKLSLLISYLRFMAAGVWYKATVRKQWDASITYGSCLKGVPLYTTMASLTIAFDVIVMILPFPTLLKLQMPNRKKIVLLGLFAMGAFISVIQIFRIQTIKSLSNLLESAALIKWSMIENNLGIIVASVPTLAPLVCYFSEQSRVGSRSRSKSQNNSGYALQASTWRNNLSRRSGVQVLGSGVDNSAEDILAGGEGIVRKTEIIIEHTPTGSQTGERLTIGEFHAK
ncbi:hypothetical protein F66182_6081 [Fusarium sp. NRRL 66182]|nr:hypothetical protein F66182_6081 [Fusarium sp. NRRL 66182]